MLVCSHIHCPHAGKFSHTLHQRSDADDAGLIVLGVY